MDKNNYVDVAMMSEQHSIMRHALGVSGYAMRQFAEKLFDIDVPEGAMWIDDVAYNTGIDASHLRNVFFSGVPLTLMDYLILSDHLGIDPINDPEANKYI